MSLTKAISTIDALIEQLQASSSNGFTLSAIPIADQQVATFGPPTDAELKIINQFTPRGLDPLRKEDCVTVTAAVFDNLVNRKLFRLDITALEQLNKLVVGIPATFNHDIYEARIVWGRTFSSQLVHIPGNQVPTGFVKGEYAKENRKILAEEGLYRVYARSFLRADNAEMIQRLRFSEFSGVSPGGIRGRTVKCGICKIPYRETVDGHKCTHYPPYWRRDLNDENEAPYSIITDMYDLYEWSLVTVPAQPLAGIV